MGDFVVVIIIIISGLLNEFASNENEKEEEKCPNGEKKRTIAFSMVRIVNGNLWLSFITSVFYVRFFLVEHIRLGFPHLPMFPFRSFTSFMRFVYLFYGFALVPFWFVLPFHALSRSHPWVLLIFITVPYYLHLLFADFPWNPDAKDKNRAKNAFNFYNALKNGDNTQWRSSFTCYHYNVLLILALILWRNTIILAAKSQSLR